VKLFRKRRSKRQAVIYGTAIHQAYENWQLAEARQIIAYGRHLRQYGEDQDTTWAVWDKMADRFLKDLAEEGEAE